MYRSHVRQLLDTKQTTPGGLPTTNVQPPGWVAPEAAQAQEEATADAATKGPDAPIIKPKDFSSDGETKRKQYKTRIDNSLDEEDWRTVTALFAHVGSPDILAREAGLSTKAVEHLLNHGIERLGMPSIRDHAINQAEVNLNLAKRRAQQKGAITESEAVEAIQQRATREAASAQRLLDQTVQAGQIISDYLEELLNRLKGGTAELAIPEFVTPAFLEQFTKIIDAHSRAVDRATKLSRLTAGESTENISMQIAVLLNNCSNEELLEAESRGTLPKRLLGRASSADPLQEVKGLPIDRNVIDVDFEPYEGNVSDEGRVDEEDLNVTDIAEIFGEPEEPEESETETEE